MLYTKFKMKKASATKSQFPHKTKITNSRASVFKITGRTPVKQNNFTKPHFLYFQVNIHTVTSIKQLL